MGRADFSCNDHASGCEGYRGDGDGDWAGGGLSSMQPQ